MAQDWIMVRLLRSTHEALERTRLSMQVADLQGQITLRRDPRHRVSLDQVIERLVAMRDRHHERVRKSKERRRQHIPILPAPAAESGNAQCVPFVEDVGAGLEVEDILDPPLPVN